MIILIEKILEWQSGHTNAEIFTYFKSKGWKHNQIREAMDAIEIIESKLLDL